jgi:hypothetical protein
LTVTTPKLFKSASNEGGLTTVTVRFGLIVKKLFANIEALTLGIPNVLDSIDTLP